jgi:PX domain
MLLLLMSEQHFPRPQTTNQNYKKSQFSVLRRYSDFVWLYDTLCNNNPGVIVPPIPEKNSLGRFQDAFVEVGPLVPAYVLPVY